MLTICTASYRLGSCCRTSQGNLSNALEASSYCSQSAFKVTHHDLRGNYATLSMLFNSYEYTENMTLWYILQCLLMGEGQASELGLSTAGQVLLGKIPPTHFCSTVVRLLALQVRALGVSSKVCWTKEFVQNHNKTCK